MHCLYVCQQNQFRCANPYYEYGVVDYMDQGEPGVDYDDPNLNPLECDLCKMKFNSLDELGEHQKRKHDM